MKQRGKYSVVRPYNDHGTMTLRDVADNRTAFIVEYDSFEVEETLAGLERDAVVYLTLKRIGCRGNAWRAMEVGSRTEHSAESNAHG